MNSESIDPAQALDSAAINLLIYNTKKHDCRKWLTPQTLRPLFITEHISGISNPGSISSGNNPGNLSDNLILLSKSTSFQSHDVYSLFVLNYDVSNCFQSRITIQMDLINENMEELS